MRKANKKVNERYQPPTPPRWRGRESLDLAFEINQRALNLVSDWAAYPDTAMWSLTTQDRKLWSTIDSLAIASAARFPFVILNVHFTDVEWWRGVIAGSLESDASDPWPANISQELMSETLIFAWHTAKWDSRVARLSLGMLPTVVTLIAGLTPQQLATVSKKHSGALRLRWADDRIFWTRLLIAARDGKEEVLAETHLHAKLLLCGDLISRST
jgi:hypothetical protein